jgi:trans-4-hydroxy-L-proline dehydratase
MTKMALDSPQYRIKQTKNLSPRIQWLRDYYFEGVNRNWNNEYTSWTIGTPWDFQYEELSFYIVPETYAFFSTFRASYNQTATAIDLHPDFWSWSIAERKAWFLKQVMVQHLPQEILPGDLLAGARFNVMISTCLNKKEAAQYHKRVHGKNGSRNAILWFHNHGYGNVGATSGHIIPDYETILTRGWEGIYNDLQAYYQALSPSEQKSAKGAQMRAMMTAATLPGELAGKYSKACQQLADSCGDPTRKGELLQMADILQKVPWKPAETFWEAVQSLWLTHMLVMSDENYPGPGVSFGRIDQLLYPMWQTSIQNGMDPETGKEILKCFWIHANTAYDGMIRTGGNQGITAGYGQLFTISGLGANEADMTNDLTYVFLEVIDEMSPILEPKPNVRIHRNSPDELMDTLVDMIADSQGAPFILNFDERSMAGMLLQAEKTNLQHLIHEGNVFEYAPVGCLENTMVGNDRSGTVDNNLNLLKAVELALTGGYDLIPFVDALTGKKDPVKRDGPNTGDSTTFNTWDDFWQAYVIQTRYIIQKIVNTYEYSESIRKQFSPTPYLSCMVKSCAKKGLDVTQGGADISLTTIEGVTFATTVDALLAIKYLVFDQNICTMAELVQALKDNWVGHEVLQARALNKAPKYGCDDDAADSLAQEVMQMWTDETWNHRTKSTNRQFRPGMLSWNYWVSDGFILPASADGRPKGKFLSNALCPSNGADTNGPTANVNSVGKALAGKLTEAFPNWQGFINLLPNGGSHTMTFNPSLLRDPEHKSKFKAFLRAYARNGGTALQVNVLDAEMLKDAQRHPENYRNLLVRVTGYNAYFTSIGKELQDEIIARESHQL